MKTTLVRVLTLHTSVLVGMASFALEWSLLAAALQRCCVAKGIACVLYKYEYSSVGPTLLLLATLHGRSSSFACRRANAASGK